MSSSVCRQYFLWDSLISIDVYFICTWRIYISSHFDGGFFQWLPFQIPFIKNGGRCHGNQGAKNVKFTSTSQSFAVMFPVTSTSTNFAVVTMETKKGDLKCFWIPFMKLSRNIYHSVCPVVFVLMYGKWSLTVLMSFRLLMTMSLIVSKLMAKEFLRVMPLTLHSYFHPYWVWQSSRYSSSVQLWQTLFSCCRSVRSPR